MRLTSYSSVLSCFLLFVFSLTCNGQFFEIAHTFADSSASAGFAASVSGVGDVNGDGIPDIIVGSPYDSTVAQYTGSIRVYSGDDGSILHVIHGDSNSDNFGFSVSGAGDVNGDGFDDFIVGSPFDDNNGIDSGNARVFSGVDGSTLYSFDGRSDLDKFGISVSGAGDVNGDGFADVIVGSPLDDQTGATLGIAQVFSGLDGSVIHILFGDSASDRFGGAVSGAGDVDGDGFADFIVGAIGDDNNGPRSGSARLFSGVDGTIVGTFDGSSNDDSFGSSVSGAGDVDGDGFDDVVVGAINDNNNGAQSGSVRIISGVDGSTIYAYLGNLPGDAMGASVSGAGDVNGDGFADVIVGVPGVDSNGFGTGVAYIYSGIDGSILETLHADPLFPNLGGPRNAVGGVGDVNGDGLADVVVSVFVANNNSTIINSGARVFTQDPNPVLNYSTETAAVSLLNLDWTPDGGDINSLTGTLLCGGAVPGSNGVLVSSFDWVDFSAFGLLPILVDGSPANVLQWIHFGYDAVGELVIPAVTRQNQFLAGIYIYVQVFETSLSIRSSNGLRFLVAP